MAFSSPLLVHAPLAHAEDASSRATATRLFDDAQQLVQQSNFVKACPKYAESNRLDPQLGTLLHLADCYEKWGKTASAWAAFKEAAEVAAKRNARGETETREQTARDRAAALEAKLSMLTINVPETEGDVAVLRDGSSVGRALWGSPIPVDPGSHTIAASAPGKKPWSTSVVVSGEGATVTVSVPVLEPEATAAIESAPPAAEPPPPAPVAPAPKHAVVKPAPEPAGTYPQKTIGVIATGAGILTMGVGGVLGLVAKGRFNESEPYCSGELCDDKGLSIREDAVARGNVATVVVGIGAAVTAGGVVVWLTAPSNSKTAARGLRFGLGPTRAEIGGVW